MPPAWGITGSEVALALIALSAVIFAVGWALPRTKGPFRALPGRDDAALKEQLDRIEQIVSASAVEVERLSEAQRYAARLLADHSTDHEQRSIARIITPH